ncbi:MAG TPA: [protein-PII] uridylyltransferase, partial [Acetobacteraceae bacterium]|nr:[protein-PII] uridylyltransferase [Acetobacteraceae bacterium]
MASQLPLPERPEDAVRILTEALAQLAPPGAPLPRDAALAVFRRYVARVQNHVQELFEAGNMPGLAAGRLLGSLTDGVIAALHDCALGQHLGPQEKLAVVATGGYGRGVLAPFSDIDLLFITRDEPSAGTLATVEFMLYFLWDLGLKVGHATRSVDECLADAARDLVIRTSMIDARLLTGDAGLFESFNTRFLAAFRQDGVGAFLAAKQAERDARHRRFGDSPFLVEPNIKEGRGGLRDLQTLYWMTRYVFGTQVMGELVGPDSPGGGILTAQEAKHARRAWSFLWTVRFHLHYVAGRAEDRLTFDLQPVVGARMGYTRHGRRDGVERFMRHYFLTARDVARITAVLEPAVIRAALGPPALQKETDRALFEQGFVLADGKLMSAPGRDFEREPINMLRILQVARDRHLGLHPLAVRALIRHERGAIALRDDPAAAEVFMDLLCGCDGERCRADGAHWLSVLNESGFLGRYIPDWARVVGQMQFDTYHVFTVDEHTIEAVRVLNALERGELTEVAPIASGVIEDLQSRRALYVATLLHDIAKGRGGDHSELGAELATEIGPALGLSGEESETVSWLVLHHLLLSQTAFKRDIDDPKTILDLADTIQSPERLKLLLVLTVADMRAVSAKVWNGWKATLLREL